MRAQSLTPGTTGMMDGEEVEFANVQVWVDAGEVAITFAAFDGLGDYTVHLTRADAVGLAEMLTQALEWAAP